MDGWFGNTEIGNRTRGSLGASGGIGVVGRGTTYLESTMLFLLFFRFRLLRGAHTPSFAHSVPMRAKDFFGTSVGENAGASEEEAHEGLFPLSCLSFSYISLRDAGCKTSIIFMFVCTPASINIPLPS
jgi:hypothetical protein